MFFLGPSLLDGRLLFPEPALKPGPLFVIDIAFQISTMPQSSLTIPIRRRFCLYESSATLDAWLEIVDIGIAAENQGNVETDAGTDKAG